MPGSQQIQWFPGHMAKTRRLIKEALPLIDIVVELLDARIPESSRNPEIGDILGTKPRMTVLGKSDMAEDHFTGRWIEKINRNNNPALAINLKSGKKLNEIMLLAKDILKDRMAAWQKKGMGRRPIRIMVIGIPNVGKSSLINRLAGGAKANVADRPGVTKGNQWFSIGDGCELLDTPGVLWPKFDDPAVGEKLAFTGAVKDNVMDMETLAVRLIDFLGEEYPNRVAQRYGVCVPEDTGGHDLLERIAKKRGMLLPGAIPDMERAAVMILDEFRCGKLGRFTLDIP